MDPSCNEEFMKNDEKHVVQFEGQYLYIDTLDWRKSTRLKLQIIAGFLVFILFGLVEQTLGTLIPIFQKHYHINDIQISLIFLASVSGYFIMAFCSETSHSRLGVQGVLVLGTSFMATSYLILSLGPPYFIVVLAYVCHGIGLGSIDASLSTWMGLLVDSNEILGILHGCYGIGCMISPPLITSLIERKINPWSWQSYYLMLSLMVSGCTISFILIYKNETALKFKYNNTIRSDDVYEEQIEMSSLSQSSNLAGPIEVATVSKQYSNEPTSSTATTADIIKLPIVWFYALSLFTYVGTEASFGSWIISYSSRILKFSYKHSSYLSATFWAGLTAGRVCLGFVTARFFTNELKANFWYFFIAFCGYFTFWIGCLYELDNTLFIIAFCTGVFVGPIFPTSIVCSIKTLNKNLHTAAIGFICAFGGGGAAAIPFFVGVVAQANFFYFPIIITIFAALNTLLWVFITKNYGSNYNSNRI